MKHLTLPPWLAEEDNLALLADVSLEQVYGEPANEIIN